jgi:hypothetical protein
VHWLFWLLVLALLCPTIGAQTIRIQVIDGEKGTPVKQATIVWTYDSDGKQILRNYNPADLSQPPSDLLDVGNADKIGISSNGFYDCRNVTYPENLRPTYSVKEIITAGIVAPNYCGKATAKPVPGVLVFFVRTPTKKEQKQDR